MTFWDINPIASGYLLALLIAALVGVTLVPTFKPMSRWQRATLIGLRMAVVLLAVILMLRPTRIHNTERPASALVLLLADQSRSMTVPDMPTGGTRWDAQREMLAEAAAIVQRMPEVAPNIEVQVYGFDADAQPVELKSDGLALPKQPTGDSTDHGTSLDDVLRDQRGKRIAAVFLTGDGAQRAYAPRVEMQQAALEVRRQGAPLYAVAFGRDIEQSQARDVAIENLPDHYSVFKNHELLIRAALRVRGYLNTPIDVDLVIEDASGKQTVLGPVQHTARKDGELIDLQLTFTPEQQGQYRLTLRAAEQPGELVTKNNEMTAFLTVREGGLKILFVEAYANEKEVRYELRYLKRALYDVDDMQLAEILIDHNHRENWPQDYSEILSDPQYDVVIIGSIAAAAMTDASIAALEQAVGVAGAERDVGKGLMLLGGKFSYGPGGWAGTKLADMLPVIIDARELQDFDADDRNDRHWLGSLQTMPARGHYITNLAGTDDENLALWRSLAPLSRANRFDRLHPQAMVLASADADTANPKPLLLARNYGDGRVLAFAGDETWRWRQKSGAIDAHRRFWRNCILWLAKRDEEQRDDVWIDLAQRRFNPGGRVEFTTGVRRGGRAAENVSLTATVVAPDDQLQPARLVPEGDSFIGLFKETTQPGNYTIEVRLPGQEEPAAQTRFVVLDEDLELGNPSANPDALAAMAEVTKDFGGRRIGPEELVELLREIQNNPPELREPITERFELGRDWGTSWLIFLLIVGLLSGEWLLRKKWGLV